MNQYSFFFTLLLTISVFSSCKENNPCVPTTSDSSTPIKTFEDGKLYLSSGYGCNHFNIIVLKGNWREMGRQYGSLLGGLMNEFYTVASRNINMSYQNMKNYSETSYNVSPSYIQEMIVGMSETSGFSLEKQKIMNVIAWLTSVASMGYSSGCSSMSAWGAYTGGGPLVIGRNMDNGDPFTQYRKYLIVVVYNPTGSPNSLVNINFVASPTGPTYLNSSGIYIDAHSGKLSDSSFNYELGQIYGYALRSAILNYSTLSDMDIMLLGKANASGMGMILDVADENECRVYEISTYDVKRRTGSDLIVSTNHFIASSWSGLPSVPLGSQGNYSNERLANLQALGEKYKGSITAARMMEIFDMTLSEGGPTFNEYTIFQVVTVPSGKVMWVKARGFTNWEKIDLNLFF